MWAAAIGVTVLVAQPSCARRETNRALDPTNELPFGFVDRPVDSGHVPALMNAGGWALDDRGIREVRLYVDGHFVNVTRLNTDRPDVAKAHPAYARGSLKHG